MVYAQVVYIAKPTIFSKGSGYGLEMPCQYHFHRDTFSCQRLRRKLIQEKFKLLE